MTLHDQLVARERAYGLLGELLRYGLRPGREQAVRGIEALGETLPDPLDLDELAAQ